MLWTDDNVAGCPSSISASVAVRKIKSKLWDLKSIQGASTS